MNFNLKQRIKESQMALDAMQKGTSPSNNRFLKMNFIDEDGHNHAKFIARDSAELRAAAMAMDASDANFNTPSSGVPQLFTIAWSNEIIRQITQKFAYKEFGDYQQGDFATTNINFPTIAHAGEVADYSDYGLDGQTSFNLNYETRDVLKKQYVVSYGDEEVARVGAAKIDAIAEKREAGAIILAQTGNDIFFYGVSGKEIRGLLNDPDLNNAIALAAGASGSSKLSKKTYEEIVKDLIAMWNSIVKNASNNLNIGDISQGMTLMTTPEDQAYLLQPNMYGRTALEYIKATFPGLRLVSAIQYRVGDGSGGNKAQLILDRINNQPVVRNGFTYQLMAHRLVPSTSSYLQKFSSGFAGAIITQPIGVCTATGV